MSSQEEEPDTVTIICECTHPKTGHRAQYGEAGKGACFTCHCSGLRIARYVLFLGERRILAKIAESKTINVFELDRQLHAESDPAADAAAAICRNLYVAGFVSYSAGATVSATSSGRQYLQETPPRG